MSPCFTDEETEVAKWYFQGLRTSEAQNIKLADTKIQDSLRRPSSSPLAETPQISCAVLKWGPLSPLGS